MANPNVSGVDKGSMKKLYVLMAHLPINKDLKEFVAVHGLFPCEWRIYSESELPRLLRDEERWRVLYREVQVREVSDVLNAEQVQALGSLTNR